MLYQYTGQPLANAQQFARRLLVNILLANGDAHLKNWSLIYPDAVTPELAPAYDSVFTRAYIENERHFALNLGKTTGPANRADRLRPAGSYLKPVRGSLALPRHGPAQPNPLAPLGSINCAARPPAPSIPSPAPANPVSHSTQTPPAP